MLGSLKRPLVSLSTVSRSFISFEKPFAGIRGARMNSMSRRRMAALFTQSLTISSQSTSCQWPCLKAKATGSPSTMSTRALWFLGASGLRCSSLNSLRKGVKPHFSLRSSASLSSSYVRRTRWSTLALPNDLGLMWTLVLLLVVLWESMLRLLVSGDSAYND